MSAARLKLKWVSDSRAIPFRSPLFAAQFCTCSVELNLPGLGAKDYLCAAGRRLREPMEAQKLLNAAPYGPETVHVLDEAWASISSTTAVGLVENTRLSLAHAIVAHAASGGIDREALKAAALDAIHKHPPRVSPDQRPITGKIKRKRAR